MQRSKLLTRLLNLAVFIILEAAALTLLTGNAQLQRIWVARAAHGFMGTVWGSTRNISNYFQLKTVNRELAQDNTRLLQELVRSQEMLRRAKVDTMQFTQRPGFQMLGAEIVRISRSSQHNFFILNKGFEDGIREKSGVITRQGVVGIIDAVSAHYSYAFSIQNRDISISARIGAEGGRGILVWDGSSKDGALLKEIPLQYQYSPGDTVYTSGHSLLFPPDIPLGIAGASKVINGATNEIKVKLFQDPGSARFVTVVHNNSFDEIEEFRP